MTHATAEPGAAPRIRVLSRRECEALLRRATVGRLAFSFHDRVDIEPIHFVYHDGWLVWRTGPGTKFTTLQHNRWVAFEVDEVDGTFDWRSVVIHGAAYLLDDATEHVATQARRDALELLRGVVPGTGTTDDPVSSRNHVFHLQVDEIAGRSSSTATSARRRPRSR